MGSSSATAAQQWVAALAGGTLATFKPARWRQARKAVLARTAPVARLAFVMDSKGMGAGAGTGPLFTINAFGRSIPSQVGALMRRAGLPVRDDTWFGAAGLPAIADVLAYDTRRTGFVGWGGGDPMLGGVALATDTTNPAIFQPSRAVDRVSVFYLGGEAVGEVKKGGETVGLDAGPAATLVRADIVFAAKTAQPISVARTNGGYMSLAGMVAWDSATPGIEIANFSAYGVTSGYQAVGARAFDPRRALGGYQPHMTIVGLGTNDLATGVALADYAANIEAIVTTAQVTGDCMLLWPSIGGQPPGYGTAVVRKQWRDRLLSIAIAKGCGFLDIEMLLGGRTSAQEQGEFADGVHEKSYANHARALLTPLLS